MRGNTVLVLILVCLASPWTAQGQGRIIIAPGAKFIGPGGVVFGPAVVLQNGMITQTDPAGNSPALLPATGDLLKFVDGSLMHGELKHMDVSAGLRWEDPAAKDPIDLKPDHIDSIRFAHAAPLTLAPTSHLRLANGDDLFGSVTSLDDNHLGFNTWFGGGLTIPRTAMQSITFLSSNYTILYEGPGDVNDWIIGNHNPESWTFRDGTYISGSPGALGRDFKLSGSSTIEFDAAWSGMFELVVCIYSDSVEHFEEGGNAYMLEFARGEVNLRYIALHGPVLVRSLGSASLPIPAGQRKARITIQSNKEEGTVAVFVDNVLAKRWKDENGFSAAGGGILFQQSGVNGVTVSLSNFKISQWAGRYEPETSVVATNTDVIRFINHDQATGKIAGINDGKISLAVGGTLLQIPLQRVTQINFAAAPVAAAPGGPWDVRAHFPRGGSLSFQLEKWSDKEVSGRSAIFGPIAFQPGQIRQLEFNLDHAKTAATVVSHGKFEGLDE